MRKEWELAMKWQFDQYKDGAVCGESSEATPAKVTPPPKRQRTLGTKHEP